MAISYVGQATATATSASLPTFTAGDFAVVFAFSDAVQSSPPAPAGWTLGFGGQYVTGCAFAGGYRTLQSGDTTTGTWTGASQVCVVVYRGAKWGQAQRDAGVTASTTITFGTLTATLLQSGVSWLVGFAGHNGATDLPGKAPSGMTNRTSGGVNRVMAADTNAGVAAWLSANVTVTGSGNGYMQMVEIIPSAGRANRRNLMGIF